MLKYFCCDIRNKNKMFACCRKDVIIPITNILFHHVNQLLNHSTFGNYNCYTEPLTIRCVIHLESLLHQMYQKSSILSFGESQCFRNPLNVLSRSVASLATKAVASPTHAVKTVHVQWK